MIKESNSLSRRNFVKLSAGSVLFLSLFRCATPKKVNYPSKVGEQALKLNALSLQAAEILKSIIQQSVPNPDTFNYSSALKFLDRFVGSLSRKDQKNVNLLFHFFEYSPIVFFYSLSRYMNLSRPDKLEFLIKWQKSRFSVRMLGMQNIRSMVGLAIYQESCIFEYINYDGPWSHIPIPKDSPYKEYFIRS